MIESKDLNQSSNSLLERKNSTFNFSSSSKEKLETVDNDLANVCHIALKYSEIDFGISEGLRTIEQQRQYVAQGKSQTMNSKHLSGQAVDVYAYVDGGAKWDIKYYIQIAQAFKKSAYQLDVKIRWGGSWTVLNDEVSAQHAYDHYLTRKKAMNEQPFVDAPHFEIIKG